VHPRPLATKHELLDLTFDVHREQPAEMEQAVHVHELLPASQTPSLGLMMKPEVANGNETDVQSGVQA